MNMIRRWLRFWRSVPCGCGVLIYETIDEHDVPVAYDVDTGLPHTCKPPLHLWKDVA